MTVDDLAASEAVDIIRIDVVHSAVAVAHDITS